MLPLATDSIPADATHFLADGRALTLTHAYDWHECGDPVPDEDGEWNMLCVFATIGGMRVGHSEFILRGGRLLPNNVEVVPEARRHGIATAMYVFAEKHTGLVCVPHSIQSADGAAFWAQRTRPFGK